MKELWRKWSKSAGFWLALIIIAQSVVYALAGMSKAYIHMDEAFSLALTQYDKLDIAANEDFYNHWHTKDYYQDYLAVQEKDRGNWQPVYENQKNDVHPPLYYLLLRGAMELVPGKFSKWPGIVLNIMIMAGCTILLYLIMLKLLAKDEHARTKALVVVLFAGLTVAGISTAVYIRMYGLLTLMVLMTLWWYLKLLEQKRPKWGMYAGISVLAVLGTLTQYYYLFFLAGLVLVTVVRYARNKSGREIGWYVGSLMVAGGLVLAIWPHILQHMFFGYRGQGVLGNLLNPAILLSQLWNYILVVDYNVFHHLLPPIVLVIAGLVIYRRQKHLPFRVSWEFWVVFGPTMSYFGLAAVASPFIELRYIMPVCGLIFGLVMYEMDGLIEGVVKKKVRASLMLGVMTIILIAMPIQINLGWMRVELLYWDRKPVMNLVEKVPEAPILYFITTENNRFLDNILPFAEAEESYLALDLLEPTTEEVKKILQGKNLADGLIVFVSTRQDVEGALKATQEATGFKNVNFIQGINTCDVYYLN